MIRVPDPPKDVDFSMQEELEKLRRLAIESMRASRELLGHGKPSALAEFRQSWAIYWKQLGAKR
jgi:hypothetical protein